VSHSEPLHHLQPYENLCTVRILIVSPCVCIGGLPSFLGGDWVQNELAFGTLQYVPCYSVLLKSQDLPFFPENA
jgi:hypothetical protein